MTPARAVMIAAHHPHHHAGAWPSGREILIGLAIIVVAVALLVGPIVGGAIFISLSNGARRAAPGAFCAGLGVLIIGLLTGTVVADIAGGGLVALVLAGSVLSYYLWPARRPAATGSVAGAFLVMFRFVTEKGKQSEIAAFFSRPRLPYQARRPSDRCYLKARNDHRRRSVRDSATCPPPGGGAVSAGTG